MTNSEQLNSVKECLIGLQEKYVFVPADKAANKIIVVCKRCYLEVIWKELGLWPDTTSSDTYVPETMDPKEISGKPHFVYKNPLDLKKMACLISFLAFIGLKSFTNHHTSIISSLHHLTAQQNLCLCSLPENYLPSKGNCQTCHKSYTVAQVSIKCVF